MAYPFSTNTLTVNESIDSIAASEASILEGLNDILCTQFVAPILVDAQSPTPTLDLSERVSLLSSVLNSMAAKECSVANVINGLVDAIVAQSPVAAPCTTSCTCNSCNTCNK